LRTHGSLLHRKDEYSVAAYTGRPKNRNGTVTIAGQTFSVKQSK
jgi:hypothetical protein